MKVLVTGGCGFIGSHVCEFYKKIGWDVIAYDNMTKYELERTGYNVELARSYNWNYLKGIGVELLKEDIRDLPQLLKSANECNFIVHTAAQPAMTISMEHPFLDFTTNVIGTYNVLEAARKYNIPAVSCATIHVYGTSINDTLKEQEKRYARVPAEIDEKHPIMTGNITPLHASKTSAENYVAAFIDTYKVKAASYRLTGLYGTRQFGGEDHGWAANFCIKALQNKPITIFGNGKQVRDILYAEDVCKAFHSFYENQVPGIYNIGGGFNNSISLLEAIEVIEKLLGRKVEYRFGGDRFGDLSYFVCDISKAKQILKWEPKIKPELGIKKLLDWISTNSKIFSI